MTQRRTRGIGRKAPLPAATLALVLAASPIAHAASAPWVGEDLDGAPCQGRSTGYGPYDYTNPDHVREKLPVVEGAHFTQNVRTLRSGKSGSVISDIDYTLRAFPNHHQALYSIIRLHTRKTPNDGRFGWQTPPECYLQRALNFTPRDGRVYTLYGIYLHRRGLYQRAAGKYQQAIEIQERAPEAHYNFGLLLLEMERYEAAREHAREAYALGYPLSGLRDKLAAAGYPL